MSLKALRRSPLVLASVLWACAPVTSPAPGSNSSGSNGPSLLGDGCAFHLTAEACRADTGRACTWDERSTTCSGPVADGGAVPASCACPAGGTCVARMGGPASPSGAVSCVGAAPGCTPTGPCTCLAGQRDCAPSPHVSGLCLCAGLGQ